MSAALLFSVPIGVLAAAWSLALYCTALQADTIQNHFKAGVTT